MMLAQDICRPKEISIFVACPLLYFHGLKLVIVNANEIDFFSPTFTLLTKQYDPIITVFRFFTKMNKSWHK